MNTAKKGLTIIDLYYLEKEISQITDSRLNQIYQTPDFIELDLFKTGGDYYKLIIDLPNWIFFSKKKQIHSEKPPAFSGFLRKNLKGLFIKKIGLKKSERIFQIEFSKKDLSYIMYVEMIPPGNIIVCDNEDNILMPLSTKLFSNRTIKRGEKYIPLMRDYNIFKMSKDEFSSIVKKSKKNLVKTIATDLGLGGSYSEELIKRSNLNKTKKELNDNEISVLYKTFKDMLRQNPKPIVYFDNDDNALNLAPFQLLTFSEFKSKEFESFSDAINFYRSSKKPVVSKEQERHYEKIKKLRSIISMQEESIKKIENEISELSKIPEKIYLNYSLINGIISELSNIISKKQFSAIDSLKSKHPEIESIDLKNRKIIFNI